jgi:aspartate aminotransferase-like enzyme
VKISKFKATQMASEYYLLKRAARDAEKDGRAALARHQDGQAETLRAALLANGWEVSTDGQVRRF